MVSFTTSPFVKRHVENPVLTCQQIPYQSELVFNAGVTRYQGKYVMAFRNDYGISEEEFAAGKRGLQTNIGVAFSDDGIHWEVRLRPVFFAAGLPFRRAYDPRLTVIDGRCYMCFAMDGEPGVVGGFAVTDDFEHFEILSWSEPDNRNMVLFPEKRNGRFLRLDRPMPVYSKGGGEAFELWLSESPDCVFWGKHRRILKSAQVPFCNSKIGPAAPPVRTKAGWLTTFHAVWKLDRPELSAWDPAGWNKIYTAGIMLLDLEDPARILGISRKPLIAPEMEYELRGFRGSAIFPGGMILEESGEVKIYYGAADTVECLATAEVGELIDACLRNE